MLPVLVIERVCCVTCRVIYSGEPFDVEHCVLWIVALWMCATGSFDDEMWTLDRRSLT